jgi:hypothetical protein
MIDERRIIRDLEGSGRGLIEVLAQNLPDETKDNYDISQSRYHHSNIHSKLYTIFILISVGTTNHFTVTW